MSDIIDRANDRMAMDLEIALAAQRAARGVVPANVESASDCIDCGLSIPSARQIAIPGVQRCVECTEMNGG